jgi:hypothetical protein
MFVLIYTVYKNRVRTSKRTPHFTITKINWLTLFKETITVYSENHTKPINTKCRMTDCQSSWYIQLPFDFKGLILRDTNTNAVTIQSHEKRQDGVNNNTGRMLQGDRAYL